MTDNRPVAMAVVASLSAFILLFVLAVSIGGSYALTLHAIHVQQAADANLKAREATAQIRTAVPTCRAINSMDVASHIPPPDFPQPPQNTYDKRLSAAIHSVNVSSHCPLILRDVAQHVPYTTILRQIQGDSSTTDRNASTQG